jgi:hypothetical protein
MEHSPGKGSETANSLRQFLGQFVSIEPDRRVQNPKVGTIKLLKKSKRETLECQPAGYGARARKAETVTDDLTRFLGHSVERQGSTGQR